MQCNWLALMLFAVSVYNAKAAVVSSCYNCMGSSNGLTPLSDTSCNSKANCTGPANSACQLSVTRTKNNKGVRGYNLMCTEMSQCRSYQENDRDGCKDSDSIPNTETCAICCTTDNCNNPDHYKKYIDSGSSKPTSIISLFSLTLLVIGRMAFE